MAKLNKLRIPKKIAGVKMPKQLRRSKGPGQRELAAAALIAVAGALLSNKKVRRTLADAGEKAAKQGAKAAAKAGRTAKEAARGAIEAAEATAKRLASKAKEQVAGAPVRRPRNGGVIAEKH